MAENSNKNKVDATKEVVKKENSQPKVIKKEAPKASTKPVAKESSKSLNDAPKASKPQEVKKAKAEVKVSQSKKVESKKTYVPNPKLNPSVFDVKVNNHVMHQVIVAHQNSLRQGTHKVKDRSEVRGGGRKPWRQKGTGRARAGSNRSPIWVGGGVVFGPKPERNYTKKINRKVYKLALRSALTYRAQNNGIEIHEFKVSKPSTKDMLTQIAKLNLTPNYKKMVIVTSDENIFKSIKNVPTINTIKVNSLNVKDILHADLIFLSQKDLKILEERVV